MSKKISFPIHTVKMLVRREVFSTITSWGPYVTISLSFLASSFLLVNYLGGIKENNIHISEDPLNFPLFISLVVVSFYLAIVSIISISREKDQGTLEVLFYGPVNCLSYLVAKFVGDLCVYVVLATLLVLYYALVSAVTNLALSWNLMEGLFLSLFAVSCIISFSLFISALTSRMRSSIIWLVAILVIFLGAYVSNSMLLRLDGEALSSSMFYLRNMVGAISKGVEWISPFTPLNKGMQAIAMGNAWLYCLNIFHSLIYSFIFLVFSIVVLERKGVRG
jgi:ABC-type transport system involved in multi-copper enzyme maturation permease subunit